MSRPVYVEDVLKAWREMPPAKQRDAVNAWRPGQAGQTARQRGHAVERWSSDQVERSLQTEMLKAAAGMGRDVTEGAPLSFKTRRRGPGRVGERFKALSDSWQRETLLESSVTRMAMNKAYQQIIGLGMAAVPLILEELRREPNYWFWALTSITGDDPAVGEDTLGGATARWLEWGEAHGYIRD